MSLPRGEFPSLAAMAGASSSSGRALAAPKAAKARGGLAPSHAPAVLVDEGTPDRMMQIVLNVLGSHNPLIESARNEALDAEKALVKAIDVAIIARQESAVGRAGLERARADEKTALEREEQASKALEVALENEKVAFAKVEKCFSDKEKASQAVKAADAAATNAVTDVAKQKEEAAAAVVAAVAETTRTKNAENTAVADAGARQQDLKNARRLHERCKDNGDEAEREEALAAERITRNEEKLVNRQQNFRDAQKRSSELKQEEEAAANAVEAAMAGAAEFAGTGSAWEIRSQKTLKEREVEWKTAAMASKKAAQAETSAEVAADDAADRLAEAKDDLEKRRQQSIEAKDELAAAIESLAKAAEVSQDADRLEHTAKADFEVADRALKKAHNAEAKVALVSVKQFTDIADKARETEEQAIGSLERAERQADVTRATVGPATAERDRALAEAAEASARVAKAGERETEADQREQVVEALLSGVEASAYALARHVYEVRMGGPSWWTDEEGQATAAKVRASRREAAELRSVASGKKTGVPELSCIDKWVLFKRSVSADAAANGVAAKEAAAAAVAVTSGAAAKEVAAAAAPPADDATREQRVSDEGSVSGSVSGSVAGSVSVKTSARLLKEPSVKKEPSELKKMSTMSNLALPTVGKEVELNVWNVRKMLYHPDGTPMSNFGLMVSDVLGSALDRGPPSAGKCTITGDGVVQASIGQVASFTIIACSAHGIRFEDGGDTFLVSIRFTGLGIRVRHKLIDNDDGSYTVSFKPPRSGKATIRVQLLGEDLPGSPFTCVVAGLEGPAPVAERCTIKGDALCRVVAREPEQFFVSFHDLTGQPSHACELDVWVQPMPYADAQPSSGQPSLGLVPRRIDKGFDSPAKSSPARIGAADAMAGGRSKVPPLAFNKGAPSPPRLEFRSPLGTQLGLGHSLLEEVDAEISGHGGEMLHAMGDFESLVVGAHPLDVSQSKALDSPFVSQLPCGHVLRLLRMELVSSDQQYERKHPGSESPKPATPKPATPPRESVVEEVVEPEEDVGEEEAEEEEAPAAPPEPPPPPLSLEEKMRRAFALVDPDGSGSVSKRELFKGLEKVFGSGMAAFKTSEGVKLFREADADGDGQLTYEEFTVIGRKLRPLLEYEEPPPVDKGPPAVAEPSPVPAEEPPATPEEVPEPEPVEEIPFTSAEQLAQAYKRGKGPMVHYLRACVLLDAVGNESWRELYPQQPAWRTLSWRERNAELQNDLDQELSSRSNGSSRSPTTGSKSSKRTSVKGEGKGSTTPGGSSPKGSFRASGSFRALASPTAGASGEGTPPPAKKKSSALSTPAAAPEASKKGRDKESGDKSRSKDKASSPAERSRSSRTSAAVEKKKQAEEAVRAADAAAAERESQQAIEKSKKDMAATKVQSRARGLIGRKQVAVKTLERAEQEEQQKAAAKLETKEDDARSRTLARVAMEKMGLPLGIDKKPKFGWVTIAIDASTGEAPEQLVSKVMGPLPAHVRRQHMEQWTRRFAIDSERERERARKRDEDLDNARREAARAKRREEADALARKLAETSPTGKFGAQRDFIEAAPIDYYRPRPAILSTSKPVRLMNRPMPKGVERPSKGAPASAPPKASARPSSAPSAPAPSTPTSPSKASKRASTARPLERSPTRSRLDSISAMPPRSSNVYLEEADLEGSGFAYGGVTSVAASAVAEAPTGAGSNEHHAVHFSVGVCGTYLLHVGLRQGGGGMAPSSTALPGSPFVLRVVPGQAHPLSTSIAELLPMCGYLRGTEPAVLDELQTSGQTQPRGAASSFAMRMTTRDKMGNACTVGGANVTCGCVSAEDDSGLDAASHATDKGDGTFMLEWWAAHAGQIEVFVKMDGLHVIGSPAILHIFKDEQTWKRHDPAERAVAEAASKAAEAEAVERARLEVVAMPAVDAALEQLIVEVLPQAVSEARELLKSEAGAAASQASQKQLKDKWEAEQERKAAMAAARKKEKDKEDERDSKSSRSKEGKSSRGGKAGGR